MLIVGRKIENHQETILQCEIQCVMRGAGSLTLGMLWSSSSGSAATAEVPLWFWQEGTILFTELNRSETCFENIESCCHLMTSTSYEDGVEISYILFHLQFFDTLKDPHSCSFALLHQTLARHTLEQHTKPSTSHPEQVLVLEIATGGFHYVFRKNEIIWACLQIFEDWIYIRKRHTGRS